MRRPLQALVVLSLAATLGAQAVSKSRYESRRTKVLAEAGQRHLRLGSAARKLGLNQQAMTQFLRGLEVSDGKNPGAQWLVGHMRGLGDAFWAKKLRRPPLRLVKSHELKARRLEERNRKDRFGLAKFADKLDLNKEAKKAYEALIRDDGGKLVFEADGSIKLRGGVVPPKYAQQFKTDALKVNGELQLRDALLSMLKEIDDIREVSSPALRVRSAMGLKQAQRIHRLLTLLLPKLAEATGGLPTRRLEVFIFAKRANFDLYLERIGYGKSPAAGLADSRLGVALVSGEKHAPAIIQSIAMHELTHIYDMSVGRVVFPSWYAEAFAETYGGQGTFVLKGDKLTAGGMLAGHRIDSLKKSKLLPVRDLIKMDAGTLLKTDRAKASLFYAQSWAFLRYLRSGAGDKIGKKMQVWEARCRGAAIGARPGRSRKRDEQPAGQLFVTMFGEHFDVIDQDFPVWLKLQ